MSKDLEHDPIYLSSELRRKYAYYRYLAGDLDKRDWVFKKMRDIIVYESQYNFNPDIYEIDAKIPKGGILDAIRDACK